MRDGAVVVATAVAVLHSGVVMRPWVWEEYGVTLDSGASRER